ncbi:MAG TPA: HAMP domain-containing sensor histidine kinase [Candidatus Saccharimonadales bacterium]|nr:HAMP domain-containing sensor histidine kinase [Candidatus Saccharimonadales bacterium]
MFRSATIRLTGLYLAILAVICLFFSLNLYRVGVGELTTGLNRQAVSYRQLPGISSLFSDDDLVQIRQNQLDHGRRDIVLELIYLNIALLSLGGVGSYYLARRTLQPIEDAHLAQSRFTSDASHELRTPLATMQAEIEVALRSKNLTATEAKKLLGSNLEELTKLTGLVTGLLHLARQNGLKDLQPVELKMVLAQVVKSYERQAKQKNIALKIKSAKSLIISGDQAALTQLVGLLVDNALKYSPPKSEVIISLTKENDDAIITVADHGQGIGPADLPKIFDRFYRADSSRHKGLEVGGYGLGLSIAKNLAKLHGGEIEATSKISQGSVFIVKLPIKP